MELCKETLENYIHNRNHNHSEENPIDPKSYTFNNNFFYINLKIFLEITKGIEYLHNQQNIIHRDLKPQNIFFSMEKKVKIGDFGLATDFYSEKYNTIKPDRKKSFNPKNLNLNLRKNSSGSNFVSDFNESSPNSNSLISQNEQKLENTICYHTKNIGTFLYASPEQLSENFYDYKSDIFSLGLIFFELIYPLRTFMEKKIKFADLKNGKICDFIMEQNLKIGNLLLNMCHIDSKKRPNAEEIIQIIKEEISKVKILRQYSSEKNEKNEKNFSNFENSGNNWNFSGTVSNDNDYDEFEIDKESTLNYDEVYLNAKSSRDFAFNAEKSFVKNLAFVNLYKKESPSESILIPMIPQQKLLVDVSTDFLSCLNKDNKDKEKTDNNPSDTNVDINSEICENNPTSVKDVKKIEVKICFYEGELFNTNNKPNLLTLANTEEKNLTDSIISFKDYVSNLHFPKFLQIFKNKIILYESENSLKADMIYNTEESNIIWDENLENENKLFYQILIINPFLKSISIFFDNYEEYFSFADYYSKFISD